MTTAVQSRSHLPALASPFRFKVWKAILLCLPLVLLTSLVVLQNLASGDIRLVLSVAIPWLVFNIFFVLTLTGGRAYRFRSIMFILIAVSLPFDFIPYMIKAYGTMTLSPDTIYSGGASFCPLTMPMIILPALVKQVITFPGALLPVATAHGAFTVMFFLWIGTSLAIGRGWCSWVCFYGGWDELFSRLGKRPIIKHKQIDRRWIYLPFAILLAIVLLAAITFTPVYCEWLCPFKIITEFQAPVNLLAVIQIAIFVTLFIGLVVVLPLLSKRRIQCGLFCPFGAMQSFFNKINIFEVRIDPEKCTDCERCIRECPTFALDKNSLVTGKPLITCTRCAHCIDHCTKDAVSYHIKGTSIHASPKTAWLLFLYPAYFMMIFLGSGFVGAALYRLAKLVTTGSML
jgi:polyferredoxin